MHLAALDVTPRGGLGGQIGSLIDTFISGRKPTQLELDRTMAGIASSLAGREVTVDEIKHIRLGMKGGSFDPRIFARRSPGSSSGSSTSQSQSRAEDPAREARAHEALKAKQARIDRLRARQVLGFGKVAPLNEGLLKGRYRELAKRHHPDRGGSVERMAEINWAVEVLRASL